MLKLSSDIIHLYNINNMSHDRDAERKNYRTGQDAVTYPLPHGTTTIRTIMNNGCALIQIKGLGRWKMSGCEVELKR